MKRLLAALMVATAAPALAGEPMLSVLAVDAQPPFTSNPADAPEPGQEVLGQNLHAQVPGMIVTASCDLPGRARITAQVAFQLEGTEVSTSKHAMIGIDVQVNRRRALGMGIQENVSRAEHYRTLLLTKTIEHEAGEVEIAVRAKRILFSGSKDLQIFYRQGDLSLLNVEFLQPYGGDCQI